MNIPIPSELQHLADAACRYVKSHKNSIVDAFAGDQYPSDKIPVSIFMAGSPGAGKTEFSKSLIATLGDKDTRLMRIDGDEIRSGLPGYTGNNAYLFQPAISLAIEKIHDHALKKQKSFVLDGTLSELEIAKKNVKRSVDRGRIVIIAYLYQDPVICWRFTQEREKTEGRNIPRNIFIEQFFASRSVAQNIKDFYGDKVRLWVFEKNIETSAFKQHLNIANIDECVPLMHTKQQLDALL